MDHTVEVATAPRKGNKPKSKGAPAAPAAPVVVETLVVETPVVAAPKRRGRKPGSTNAQPSDVLPRLRERLAEMRAHLALRSGILDAVKAAREKVGQVGAAITVTATAPNPDETTLARLRALAAEKIEAEAALVSAEKADEEWVKRRANLHLQVNAPAAMLGKALIALAETDPAAAAVLAVLTAPAATVAPPAATG